MTIGALLKRYIVNVYIVIFKIGKNMAYLVFGIWGTGGRLLGSYIYPEDSYPNPNLGRLYSTDRPGVSITDWV